MRRAILILLAALLSAGPVHGREPPRYDAALNARLFDRAWSLVERRYWDPDMRGVDWEAARDRFRPQALAARDERSFYAVLNAMLDTLRDSHVYATGPTRLDRIEDRARAGGTALGLGFVAVDEDGVWRISSVVPGSPSDRAGIGVGWRLLAIDGRAIDLDYQPPDGADVLLDLQDEAGRPRRVTLRPTEYAAGSDWGATRLDGGVLLLRLDSFEPGADSWLVRQLSAAPPPAGVIVDLRENGGGGSAVLDRVAGAFFDERRIVLRLVQRGERKEWTRGAGPSAYRGPLAMLVGRRTASAAEALAAMIAESGRGSIVGERTAGRLTGGTHHRLPDGGELSLAEYDIRTPEGRRIEGVGLVPQHLVPAGLAHRGRQDAALVRARQLLATTKRDGVQSPSR